jgi:hypothetical protein
MIPLLSSQTVSATLYRLADWFKPENERPAKGRVVAQTRGPAAIYPLLRGQSQVPAPNRGPRTVTNHRPLRIVRVIDAGQARNNAGRIVISGRIDDICAELDRMAQRESAAA